MQVKLEVDTFEPFSLLSHLMGREFPAPDSEAVLSEGVVVTFKQRIARRSGTIGDTIIFIVTVVASIGAQVAATEITHWLHKAKEQAKTVRIEREEVVIERDKITRIIEKRIEIAGNREQRQSSRIANPSAKQSIKKTPRQPAQKRVRLPKPN